MNFGVCGDPRRFKWHCRTSKQKNTISLLTTRSLGWFRGSFLLCQQLIVQLKPTTTELQWRLVFFFTSGSDWVLTRCLPGNVYNGSQWQVETVGGNDIIFSHWKSLREMRLAEKKSNQFPRSLNKSHCSNILCSITKS